ncbi:hypothetical protein DFP72DRAFT_915969 [Ephemerocybe angulata]|uniref:MYND-type domain-containing protein n=1 Tax=Ephemerocybe angulata TaxID=980116 RepID=A0A8H6HN34_9AGAR|nr:hypothetical protein DFP72DRAFT_915969 [Tulosesus angulatus]
MSDEVANPAPEMTPPLHFEWRRISVTRDTPNELWFVIAGLLVPLDMISLQSTCLTLKELLHQRSVWIAVLKAMCFRNSLFYPSYSPDTMSLAQIQRCAFGPEAFKRRVLKESRAIAISDNSDKALSRSPTGKRRPVVESKNVPLRYANQQRGSGVYLVPGGRFLVIFDSVALALWDLGIAGFRPLENPLLVAQTRFRLGEFGVNEAEHGPRISVRVTEDDGLRVAVAWGIGKVIVKVFELSSIAEGAAFLPLGTFAVDASLEVDHPFCRVLELHGDRVLIMVGLASGRDCIIWDFISSLYIVIDGRPGFLKSAEAYLTEYEVVELTPTAVAIWFVPHEYMKMFGRTVTPESLLPIAPRSNSQEAMAYKIIPYPHLQAGRYGRSNHILKVVPANVYTGQGQFSFDILTHVGKTNAARMAQDEGGETVVVTRYRLELVHSRSGAGDLTMDATLKTLAKFPISTAVSISEQFLNRTALTSPRQFAAPIVVGKVKVGERDETLRVIRSVWSSIITYTAECTGEHHDSRGPPKWALMCDSKEFKCGRREASGGVQLKRCSGCQIALYCSDYCQRRDWKVHKAACKALELLKEMPSPVSPVRYTQTTTFMPEAFLQVFIGLCTSSGRDVFIGQGQEDDMGVLNSNGVLTIHDYLAE